MMEITNTVDRCPRLLRAGDGYPRGAGCGCHSRVRSRTACGASGHGGHAGCPR